MDLCRPCPRQMLSTPAKLFIDQKCARYKPTIIKSNGDVILRSEFNKYVVKLPIPLYQATLTVRYVLYPSAIFSKPDRSCISPDLLLSYSLRSTSASTPLISQLKQNNLQLYSTTYSALPSTALPNVCFGPTVKSKRPCSPDFKAKLCRTYTGIATTLWLLMWQDIRRKLPSGGIKDKTLSL